MSSSDTTTDVGAGGSDAVHSTANAIAVVSPHSNTQSPSSPPVCEDQFTEEARRRGLIPFREYVDELRNGVKLSKAERIRRYGTSDPPAPVALFTGETEAEYEEELCKWFQFRKGSIELTPVQRKSIAADFARKRAMWYRGNPRKTKLYADRPSLTTTSSSAEAPGENLCETIHVNMKDYELWLQCGFFEQLKTLSQAQIYDRFDMKMPPIYVPLVASEKPEMYEKRFGKWLADVHSTTLEELRSHTDHLEERGYRVRFAALNAKGTEKFMPPPKVKAKTKAKAKRPSDATKAVEPPAKKMKTNDNDELEEGEVMEVDEKPTTASNTQPITTPDKAKGQLIKSCTGRDSIESCVECGCTQCLIRGSALVGEMERSSIKSEEPHMSNGSKSSGTIENSATASITALLLSRPTTQELHDRISTRLSAIASERVQREVDPIEMKLTSDYDVINNAVVADEKVLEASTTRLALAPVTNAQEHTQRLQENKLKQERIESGIIRRNSALSALVVYFWRDDMNELVAMINDPQATNVSRVKRVTHQKCTQISSQIQAKRQLVHDLKAQIDSVMANESSDGSAFVATNEALAQLGASLLTSESEIKKLEAQRRLEFKTLIRCDERLRQQIKQFLSPAK